MRFLKRNFGWMTVAILASLPLLVIFSMLEVNLANGLSISLVESSPDADRTTLEMLYHVSGEFAIRWMTAVLTLTPIFIIFGISNLFVRQAMGIATAVWSLLHFVIFIAAEGFLETFTAFNYIAGFVATLILVPMLITSNRRSMRLLKSNWKKLQKFVYPAIILSLLHVILLEKTWLIYGIIVGIGFIIRIPVVKEFFVSRRLDKRTSNN